MVSRVRNTMEWVFLEEMGFRRDGLFVFFGPCAHSTGEHIPLRFSIRLDCVPC